MIVGIGTDLIEIERVKRACEKEAFLMRYFTIREQEMFGNNYVKYAGNFAVKEAVAKCFGTGFREFMPIDIEVLRNAVGAPYVNLYKNAFTYAEEAGITNIHVSISNTKEHAAAFAVAESR